MYAVPAGLQQQRERQGGAVVAEGGRESRRQGRAVVWDGAGDVGVGRHAGRRTLWETLMKCETRADRTSV